MASTHPRLIRPMHVLLGLVGYAAFVSAHEHHDEDLPPGQVITFDPVDSILWTHIFFMTLSFGVLFPTGMVLGLSKSRWHVPVQIVATTLAIVGWFLGHAHKGRQFAHNIHSSFAPFVALLFITQVVFGIYLKLHLERGINKYIRKAAVLCHGTIGKMTPVVSWVQMGFGGITLLGFCRADHLGQCLAHGIMGSSFIGYGAVMAIMLLLGQAWLVRRNKSQEFFDSSVIAAWGLVNTFTEHRWGSNWSHKDFQHTSMGIIWFCAGILGVFLSSRKGKPTRNVIPAVVIILTGWAMAGHQQELEFSTKLHATFGHTLMAAGVTRIIEIVIILRDSWNAGDDEIRSFQYVPPFLLVASGLLFMGANEEQIVLLVSAHVDPVSYSLVLYSLSFVVYFFILYLIWLFTSSGRNIDNGLPKYNGANHSVPNGHGRMTSMEQRRVRDVEEFELGALLDDEDEDAALRDSGSIDNGLLAKRSSID